MLGIAIRQGHPRVGEFEGMNGLSWVFQYPNSRVALANHLILSEKHSNGLRSSNAYFSKCSHIPADKFTVQLNCGFRQMLKDLSRITIPKACYKINVYAHRTFGDLFNEYRNQVSNFDKKYSLRWLSKRLEINHATLVRIANGSRLPSAKLLNKLLRYIGIEDQEAAYLRALVGFQRTKDFKQKAYYAKILIEIAPKNPDILMDIDTFQLICNWQNFAILSLFDLKNFSDELDWII